MTRIRYSTSQRILRRCKRVGVYPLNSIRKLVGASQRVYSNIQRHRHLKRSEPPCAPLHLSIDTQADQAGSKLLNLPPEIRSIIWSFVVASHPIVLHRKGGRITHRLLEEDGPDEVTTITPQVLSQVKDAHMVDKQSSTVGSGLLGILQTCQMIYTEIITILYTASTFVILDNEVLKDFCFSTRAQHTSSIKSLHLHFRFRRELLPLGVFNVPFRGELTIPAPWDEDTFATLTDIIVRGMPNLTSVSIFVQGPLVRLDNWHTVTTALRSMKERLNYLASITVRLPRPAIPGILLWRGYNVADQASDWDCRLKFIPGMIQELREHMRVVQPELWDAQFEHDLADWDTGDDAGWKIGTLYLPAKGEGGAVEERHYAVPVEDEQERTRRCPRFGDILVSKKATVWP